MSKFELHYDEEDELVTCDCCGYPTALVEYTSTGKATVMLCEICYSTFLSKAILYPNQCSDTSLYQSIGYIGNMILDAVGRKK